ncbi:MAG: RNA polymerase sigma factor [Phycisphaerae bacterium]|nr:RNA polymerase sigma factor [Phycisphaerae bacterium]
MSEAELMQSAVAGDVAALSELLRQHAPLVRNQLSIDSKWQSAIDADDVIQVTLLEAFLRIDSFSPTGAGSFYRWLSRIADNNLRDAIKGLERLKRPPPAVQAARGADESCVDLIALLGVTSTTPSRVVGQKEARTALHAALAALPEDYQSVVRLYDLEGRSIADVAQAIGRSPGAVHMLRARAHARLTEIMSPAEFWSTIA